jgi:hypothetical protein
LINLKIVSDNPTSENERVTQIFEALKNNLEEVNFDSLLHEIPLEIEDNFFICGLLVIRILFLKSLMK